MNDKVDYQLIFDILKAVQESQARMEGKLNEHSEQFIRLREAIHDMRGDALRQERSIAAVQVDVERLNKRLGLIDPTH